MTQGATKKESDPVRRLKIQFSKRAEVRQQISNWTEVFCLDFAGSGLSDGECAAHVPGDGVAQVYGFCCLQILREETHRRVSIFFHAPKHRGYHQNEEAPRTVFVGALFVLSDPNHQISALGNRLGC